MGLFLYEAAVIDRIHGCVHEWLRSGLDPAVSCKKGKGRGALRYDRLPTAHNRGLRTTTGSPSLPADPVTFRMPLL